MGGRIFGGGRSIEVVAGVSSCHPLAGRKLEPAVGVPPVT